LLYKCAKIPLEITCGTWQIFIFYHIHASFLKHLAIEVKEVLHLPVLTAICKLNVLYIPCVNIQLID